MSMTHTQVISSETVKTFYGKLTREHTITYKISNTPLKQLNRWDLPKSYELDSWESEEDTWIKINGEIYNVSEFCTVGMPNLPGPNGGAQLASNGYISIVAFKGEIHTVSTSESRPL